MLAIEGQVKQSLWDNTKGDVRFPAIQTLECPIELLKLMKLRATGTQSGVWAPLALFIQLQKNIGHRKLHRGVVATVRKFKREVESSVATTV